MLRHKDRSRGGETSIIHGSVSRRVQAHLAGGSSYIRPDFPDPRRSQAQLYKLPHVLLFAILAIVTGCNSYRVIITFIDVHRRMLNVAFGHALPLRAHLTTRFKRAGRSALRVIAHHIM